jgi:cell division GTPase FtsZ
VPLAMRDSSCHSASGARVHSLKAVDTLLVIPNQNLFRVANEKTTFADTFVLADQVLFRGWPALATLSSRKV